MNTNRILFLGLLLMISFSSFSQKYYERKRLGDHINTAYTETKPIISYDNSTLYLTRQYHPENTGGKDDIQDIYIAKKDKELLWSKPSNVGAPLNNLFPNGISSLSHGGDTALVINVFSEDNYEKGASLSFKTASGWTSPAGITIDGFKNKSDFVDYFVSADGKKLFLAIEGKDTYGDQDIYVSEKIDDFHWSTPVNIGANVNTGDAEFSPFLSPDNKTLFFSSYGHKGFGNADIFYSVRLDDSWTNWSPAKNIGDRFNTSGFEAYFTIPSRGEYAYFVSDVNSNKDSRDIFRAIIPLELNPTPGMIVSGVTKNDVTGAAFTANVKITSPDPNIDDKIFVTDEPDHRYYRSIFEFPKTFRMLAEEKNFMSTSQYLKVAYADKREITADLYLVPIALGNTLVSHDVEFLKGTSSLTALGKEELGRMAKYMKDYPTIKFEVASHVEKSGNADADLELSKERIQVISEYFLAQGIASKRFTTAKALGSTVPFANEKNILVRNPETPNDRVSFTIVSDKDEDTVKDEEDKCPEEKGLADNSGCEPLSEETVKVFQEALQGIQFETAKDIIKPVSFPILDNVVRIMKENKGYFLKISGHTDSQGNDADNQDLSERRAASTKKYLVEHGVSADRLKEYGFGETQPVDTNDTPEGRAKNRRVVFEVVYAAEDL